MGKYANDSVMDAALNQIATGNLMLACPSQPADRAGAIASALADVAMTPGTDYTIADGDTSGRKVTIAAKSGVTVDSDGTITHVALVNNTELLLVTTSNSQPVVAGNTINFPAWDDEIADPV